MNRTGTTYPARRQRGAVIIMVLWTAVLLTVLVTVLASKVKLSARTALHNKEGSADLAEIVGAISRAEMELMLEAMDLPINNIPETAEDGDFRVPSYRFNGQPMTLQYPGEEDMIVRIYSHAGKINLNDIPRQDMQLLIQKQLGPDADPDEINELLAAWADWTDLNSLPGVNGAEDEYYNQLDPPYSPRNSPDLESVDELRLIRGFDELFKDVNLDAAFTVYGNGRTVNLNMATREAMRLLPGLNDELIEQIIAYRELQDFNTKPEVGELVPFENMVELSSWIGNQNSTFYSVYAYPAYQEAFNREPVASGQETEDQPGGGNPVVDPVTQAYMQIMEVRGANSRGRVYQVDPYGQLPDTRPAQLPE